MLLDCLDERGRRDGKQHRSERRLWTAVNSNTTAFHRRSGFLLATDEPRKFGRPSPQVSSLLCSSEDNGTGDFWFGKQVDDVESQVPEMPSCKRRLNEHLCCDLRCCGLAVRFEFTGCSPRMIQGRKLKFDLVLAMRLGCTASYTAPLCNPTQSPLQ
jgi:hypothetical protein